ncbi:hypothetical protein GCM10023169_09880 [Georgenia halophila]|uniref:Uncharacterized protein n=1 Tax=Georgenia halophila TaxID=620889 RepID=A0ABP8KZM7_9MICO
MDLPERRHIQVSRVHTWLLVGVVALAGMIVGSVLESPMERDPWHWFSALMMVGAVVIQLVRSRLVTSTAVNRVGWAIAITGMAGGLMSLLIL